MGRRTLSRGTLGAELAQPAGLARRIALAVGLLVAAVVTTPVAAAQPENAVAALGRALELVRTSRQATDPDSRARSLAAALRELDTTPGLAGSSWLREPLTSAPPDPERAEQRLIAALELLSGERQPSDALADRRALEKVLADPRFQSFDWHSLVPGWLTPLFDGVTALLRVLWNLLRWPIDRLLDLLARGLTYGPVVLLLGLALVAAIVMLYARGLRGALVVQAEVAPSEAPLPPTSGEALRLAQHEATLGHYREASHFLFSATLLWLEERGRFRFEPTATNQEHLASIAGDAIVADGLRPFVLRFDRIWYGQEQVSPQDYGELAQLAVRLRERVA